MNDMNITYHEASLTRFVGKLLLQHNNRCYLLLYHKDTYWFLWRSEKGIA